MQNLECGRDAEWLRAQRQAARMIITIFMKLASIGTLTAQSKASFALRILSGKLRKSRARR